MAGLSRAHHDGFAQSSLNRGKCNADKSVGHMSARVM